MTDLQNSFKQFMQDEGAGEMFITGQAGTGKTTKLSELLNYCMQNDIEAVVCAFTHKACGILMDKLPAGVTIRTLHSVLKKRPMINDTALKAQHIEVSRQHAKPDEYQVMFIDEFSMVGEKDYMDVIAMQESEDGETIAMKVVYIGDLNQLPPVGDMHTITPHAPHWVNLTHIYRQADGNQLLDTLSDLVKMIEGGEAKPLKSNQNFQRGVDITKWYMTYEPSSDNVMLAFTNERVENLNAQIAGKTTPEHNDELFSPTRREHFIMDHFIPPSKVFEIGKAFGDELLELDSKYKTLEHLLLMPEIKFIQMHTMYEGDFVTYATVFGHYQYKLYLDELKQQAAKANRDIELRYGIKAPVWARANPRTTEARTRALAWRNYLTFKECVICLDFPYAMTVHKSQGSTYDTVFIDTDDLYKCANSNFQLYLKLMYVSISRASNMVYTN